MADEIKQIFDSYNYNTLWEMARAAYMEVTDRNGRKLRKKELLPKMREEYFNEARVKASLEELNERERAVLDRLLLHGDTIPTQSFRREVVRAGLATNPEPQNNRTYRSRIPYASGYIGSPRRADSRVFEDVIARLTYYGLVFSRGTTGWYGGTEYKVQFHPGATLYIPKVIHRHLPEPEPIPIETSDLEPKQVRTSDPTMLLRDLYLYWDFVRQNQVRLIKAGFVSKRSLKAANEVLLAPDPALKSVKREDETARLYLLRQLLETLNLVQKKGRELSLTTKDALQLPEFWSWAPEEQLSACLEAWLKIAASGDWSSGARQYGPNYPHAKRTVLDILKTLTPNAWFELEDILERVQIQDGNFLFPERTRIEGYRGGWYYSYTGSHYYGNSTTLLKSFDKFEENFIRHCISGFLFQTGVVELGYNLQNPANIDEWQMFRLTPFGQEILGVKTDKPAAHHVKEEVGKLVIQPNFQLLVMGTLSPALLAKLDLFADREKADRGAFEYHLSRESVYRAQQMGMEVQEVISFLKQHSATEIPQNIHRSLQEWAAHHERIIFRTNVSLLQTANNELLTRLMEEQDTSKYISRALTPEIAVLKNNRGQQLISKLVQRGLFPARADASPATADNSVVIHQDGTVRPLHDVPSLHLRGRLSRLAEEDNGYWRLTPASISRAGGSRNKVLGILEELRKLQRGRFPDSLEEQIKAWGNYYGDAAVENLTLIEFRDQSALNELLKISELKARLTPFPTGQRALAIVQNEEMEEIRGILSRFGVRVKEGGLRS